MKNFLLVFIGGGSGAAVRYLLNLYVPAFYSFSFPLHTLVANIAACAFAGVIVFQLPAHGSYRLLLLTGFCGGLSTFSAFTVESVELLQQGKFFLSSLNIFLNIVLCLTVYIIALKLRL